MADNKHKNRDQVRYNQWLATLENKPPLVDDKEWEDYRNTVFNKRPSNVSDNDWMNHMMNLIPQPKLNGNSVNVSGANQVPVPQENKGQTIQEAGGAGTEVNGNTSMQEETIQPEQAQEESPEQLEEEVKNNPNVWTAMSKKEKWEKINDVFKGWVVPPLEKAFQTAGDMAKGAYEGFNRMSLSGAKPTTYESLMRKLQEARVDNAVKASQSHNKGTENQAERRGIIDAMPQFNGFTDEQKDLLASMLSGQELSIEQFKKEMFGDMTVDSNALRNYYNAYRNAWQTNTTGTNARILSAQEKKQLQDVIKGNYEVIGSRIKTQTEKDTAIRQLEQSKAELNAELNKLDYNLNVDQFYTIMERSLGIVNGVWTSDKGNNSSWNVGGDAKGYVPGVASASVNGGYESGKRSNEATDVLRLANIPAARKDAKDFVGNNKKYIDAAKKAITEQIKYIDEAIERIKSIPIDGMVSYVGEQRAKRAPSREEQKQTIYGGLTAHA